MKPNEVLLLCFGLLLKHVFLFCRLRDLSSLEAGEHSELNPVKKGRSKSQHSRKDGLVDKIPLDEKLKQIDLLMERVCQR